MIRTGCAGMPLEVKVGLDSISDYEALTLMVSSLQRLNEQSIVLYHFSEEAVNRLAQGHVLEQVWVPFPEIPKSESAWQRISAPPGLTPTATLVAATCASNVISSHEARVAEVDATTKAPFVGRHEAQWIRRINGILRRVAIRRTRRCHNRIDGGKDRRRRVVVAVD
jgi:hypothetical protein